MDNIGTQIAQRIGPDNRVAVRMIENGRDQRLQAIDAREAIESRRGQLCGPVINPVPRNVQRIRPEMSEDEIIAQLEAPTVVDVVRGNQQGNAVMRDLAQGRAPGASAVHAPSPHVPQPPARRAPSAPPAPHAQPVPHQLTHPAPQQEPEE